MPHPEITCADVVNFICEQFGEDDGSERCRAIREHLQNCPDCSEYCNSMDKMIGLYRASSPDFPSDVRAHLFKTLGMRP
jgi:predicted anti-sigma-YlaC factor YlaD